MQEDTRVMVSQIPEIFAETGQEAELRAALERGIREHSATSEALFWLCKERNGKWSELITPDLLAAILGALERDQHNENSARNEVARSAARRSRIDSGDVSQCGNGCGARFDAPSHAHAGLRRSDEAFLARPNHQALSRNWEAMVTGEQKEEKTEALVVSWSSLHRRKAEYEELIKKKIPENSKRDLASRAPMATCARISNSRRRNKCRPCSCVARPNWNRCCIARGEPHSRIRILSQVSIGTIVTLRDSDSETEETYTILGAWDGDPERAYHLLSDGDRAGAARTLVRRNRYPQHRPGQRTFCHYFD